MDEIYFVKCTKSFVNSIDNKEIDEINFECDGDKGRFVIGGASEGEREFLCTVTRYGDDLINVARFDDTNKIVDLSSFQSVSLGLVIQADGDSFQIAKKEILNEENLRLEKREKVKTLSAPREKSIEEKSLTKKTASKTKTKTGVKSLKKVKSSIVDDLKQSSLKDDSDDKDKLSLFQQNKIKTIKKEMNIYNSSLQQFEILRLKYLEKNDLRVKLEDQFKKCLEMEDAAGLKECEQEVTNFCKWFTAERTDEFQELRKICDKMIVMRHDLRLDEFQ